MGHNTFAILSVPNEKGEMLRMRTFAEILKRHGFIENDFDSKGLCGDYLRQTVKVFGYKPAMEERIFEESWMDCMEEAKCHVERWGREASVDPDVADLPLAELDSHIRGIVRWLNQIGLTTLYSCDGHDRRSAYVDLKIKPSKKQLKWLKDCAPKQLDIRGAYSKEHNRLYFKYQVGQKDKLLEYAATLHDVIFSDFVREEIEIEAMRAEIMKWLAIPGESGQEHVVRTRLEKELQKLLDYTVIDKAGNLLGEIKYGEGPTILLSAHMDIYSELEDNRKIVEKGTILSSSSGILGADDRAGIAAVISILKRIPDSNFSGEIKVAFTVEEEVGCVGSRNISPGFLANVDAAIVFDRRGNRDIVTSYANYTRFCTTEFGELFEEAGRLVGMPDWKVTAGGLSDARVFSEYDIQSVNLSVGYQHEHTDLETVDYAETLETVRLVEGILDCGLIKKREIISS